MRDWIAYQPSIDGRAYKAPQRNADAYLKLKAWHGTLTRPAAAVLAVQNRAEFRGAGRTNVLSRLDRLANLWTQLPTTQDAQTLVAHVLDPARWVTYQSGDAALAAEDIGRLRREADRMIGNAPDATIGDIVTGLRFRIATREPLGDEPNPAAVQIVTLWGAKGLTADYVYIGGLVDEALPGPHDEDSSGLTPAEHQDEQRRLLYVSLTRAKHGLVISKPTKIRVGQIAALGLLRTTKRNMYWQYLSDCRFLANVSPANLPASQDGTAWPGIP
jgi:superfamily I DNA/RNA helicase